jgi:hypothetical protein
VNPPQTRDELENNPRLDYEGVNCEACHGAAGRWLEPHKRNDWNGFNKSALNFNDTKDSLNLSAKCVDCHVGAAGRDVDHDLIAAGHPRLYFEMAAALERMPRHWLKDQGRKIDLEPRLWAVGQFVAAEAAVSLLEYRASSKPNAVWPEFAESACFSCHHDLAQPSNWQQQRKPDAPLGVPRWGSWYFALVNGLANEFKGDANIDIDAFQQQVRELQLGMEKPIPSLDRVQEKLPRIRDRLCRLAAAANRGDTTFYNGHRDEILRFLLNESGRRLGQDWEGSVQVYLGLAAVAEYDHELWRKNLPAAAARGPVFDELKNVRDLLKFPPRLSSPRKFDDHRMKELSDRLKMLRDLIFPK